MVDLLQSVKISGLSATLYSLVLLCWGMSGSVNPEGSLVNKLMSQRETLMQDGLSFFNGTSVSNMQAKSHGHEIRCLIHIENWTKWLLGYPVYYTKYGVFQRGQYFFVLNLYLSTYEC